MSGRRARNGVGVIVVVEEQSEGIAAARDTGVLWSSRLRGSAGVNSIRARVRNLKRKLTFFKP